MAEINFGILDTQSPAKIGNAFIRTPEQQNANMLQVMQMQHLQRQGQSEEMALAKLKREEDALNKFHAFVASKGGPTDPVEMENAMIGTKIPHFMDMGIKARQTRLQLEQDRAAMGLSPVGVAAAPSAPVSPFSADMASNRAALPSFGGNQLAATAGTQPVAAPTNAMVAPDKQAAIIAAKQKMLSANPGVRDAGKMELEQLVKPGVQHVVGDKLIGSGGQVIYEGAFKPPTPPSMVAEYTFAKTPDGGNFRGSYQDFVTARAAAGRAPAQPRAEQPAQPVIDPDTGKIILVSREEAIRRRMTPAQSDTKPLTAQQQLKAKETKVTQRGVVTSAETAATELETLADKLLGNPDKKIKPNPGLSGITGYMGLVPSLPNTAARSAQQQLDTFKGKVMAFGRLLATQQGKLGNMAVSEWKFIADAVEKIDPAAKNFDDQLRDVVRQAKDFAVAKRETFNELHDGTTSAGTTPASAANAPGQWGKAVAE